MDNKDQNDLSLWKRLVNTYMEFGLVLQEFISRDVDRVAIIKSALNSEDRVIAISLLRYLNVTDLKRLFDQLVFLSSFSHGAISTIREVILSMPRDWVLSNIESTAEKFLTNGTYDEYRRILELYNELDQDLTSKLARRAMSNSDDDIREAGEDFLLKLGELKNSTN